MKKLYPLLCLTLALLCITASAAALTVTEDALSGVICWPEDADPAEAVYVYRYSYPQAEGEDEPGASINEYYHYLVEDDTAFRVPMAGEMIADTSVQSVTNVRGSVTYQGDDYLSILLTTDSDMEGEKSTGCSAHTFHLTGDRAGKATTLPWLMGLLTDADSANDSWLETRQTEKANMLVRSLVWSQLRREMTKGEHAFYPELDEEMLALVFYPEEDFYLDADGSLVFFIQPGFVAEPAEGLLTFRYTMEELLDEL